MKKFRSFGITIFVLVAIVGIAVYTSKPNQRKDVAAVQRVIDRIEQHSGQFAQRVRQAFVLLPRPEIFGMLSMPFELWELNRKNPNRNYPAFRQLVGGGEFWQEDINFFAYDRGDTTGMTATFAPVLRCMYLDARFDPGNDLDWLVIYHETHHAAQDVRWRAEFDTREKYEAYLAFHTLSSPAEQRIILNYETTAYAYELECFNLLTGDEFRQLAAFGRYNVDELLATLKARAEQRGTIDVLGQFAITYWPDGM